MEEHRASVKRARLDTQDARPDADPASGSAPESSGVVHPAPAHPPQPGTQFFIRDENFWFEDGNIILAARSVGFKVYKGLLAEHSTVFRSMFVVAQGAHAAGEQAPDGCPVVPLDDSPEDLRQLFRLIYPLTSNIRIDRGGVDINMLSAVIHLDHKYELPTLQAQAMSYLTTYYTSHFEHWVDGTHATPWKPTPLDAIGAIAIAHLTNTMSILPTAFYDLCSASVLDVLKGRARSDGSFQKLSEDDLELYIRTRDKLTYLNARVPFLLFRPAKDCIFGRHAVTECAVHMKAILSCSGLSHLPHTITSVRALDSWLQNLSEHAATNADTDHRGTLPGLCARCKSYAEKRDRELRQQVWRKLPGGMGITVEGWDASS